MEWKIKALDRFFFFKVPCLDYSVTHLEQNRYQSLCADLVKTVLFNTTLDFTAICCNVWSVLSIRGAIWSDSPPSVGRWKLGTDVARL